MAVPVRSRPIADETIRCELNKFGWGIYKGPTCRAETDLFSETALTDLGPQIQNSCSLGFVLMASEHMGLRVF